MAGELIAGLGIVKSMLDLANALKDINDAVIRNGAVIELQKKSSLRASNKRRCWSA